MCFGAKKSCLENAFGMNEDYLCPTPSSNWGVSPGCFSRGASHNSLSFCVCVKVPRIPPHICTSATVFINCVCVLCIIITYFLAFTYKLLKTDDTVALTLAGIFLSLPRPRDGPRFRYGWVGGDRGRTLKLSLQSKLSSKN